MDPCLLTLEYNLSVFKDLNNICSPLEKTFGFNFLTYRKIFNNGKTFHLSNNNEWMLYATEHKYWTSTSSYERIIKAKQQQIILHPWGIRPPKDDLVYGSMYNLNIWNGITLYEKTSTGVVLWAFAADRSKEYANDFYLKNISLLYHFINYFKDKCSDIITHQENLLVPSIRRLTMCTQEEKQDFFNKTPIKNFHIEKNGKKIQIAKRETEIIFLLSHGKSMKQIANILSISTRTVKHYVEQAKIKLDCFSKTQLIDILDNNPIIKQSFPNLKLPTEVIIS